MQGMKPSPAMLGTGKIFWVLFLIPHLGLCSNHGEEPCEVQLHVKRHLEHIVSVGKPFRMECPVKYCASRPNVTWCKLNGTECLDLGDRHHLHTSWEERKSISIFILHFEPVFPSDNGSYRCSAQFTSHVVTSHSIIIHVIEHAQNNSEFPLTNATSASGPPFEKETTDSQWLLLHLLPLMALPLLIIACYCLIYGLKRYQGKQKKPSDIAGREINLVDAPQPLSSEQAEDSCRQNSQTLPPEAGIYDNDSWFRTQEGAEVYSYPRLEENKQGIVYASLNHSVIGRNPRQARNVQEAPTEYASICVRS